MNEEKLKEAVSLYKQGNKSQAAILLGEIVRQDPNNSNAWYGLALSLDEKDKKIFCLKKSCCARTLPSKSTPTFGTIASRAKISCFIAREGGKKCSAFNTTTSIEKSNKKRRLKNQHLSRRN
ncbi:MAG: hypothetical protein UZ14_CFX002002543 [Chloroflexi bacterium OLB14]|nr:MAG: hypothetical protein UZ14_CFX002002543 [Chloroflexi bacterium OLB14]